MFDPFRDGYCPQCLLDNERRPMILNTSDFWECPACHLQAYTGSPGMFALLHGRGQGNLKEEKATGHIIGWILCAAQKGDWRKIGQDFQSEAGFRDFLKTVQ